MTETDVVEGTIPITPGLQHMLDFYSLGPSLTFEWGGHYLVQAEVRGDHVWGTELAAWFHENGLRAGHTVLVFSPRRMGARPRLAPGDSRTLRAVPGLRRSQHLHLRHWCHVMLKEPPAQARHYRRLSEAIASEIGRPVAPASLAATLSANDHLFLPVGRGLWMLAGQKGERAEVDELDLVFALAEDDLVFATLEAASRPLTLEEICVLVAEHFKVRVHVVLSTSPLDAQDARLVRWDDGRWALRCWGPEAEPSYGGRVPSGLEDTPKGVAGGVEMHAPTHGTSEGGDAGLNAEVDTGGKRPLSAAGEAFPPPGPLVARQPATLLSPRVWALEARVLEAQGEILRLCARLARFQTEAQQWHKRCLWALICGLLFPPCWLLAVFCWCRYRGARNHVVEAQAVLARAEARSAEAARGLDAARREVPSGHQNWAVGPEPVQPARIVRLGNR